MNATDTFVHLPTATFLWFDYALFVAMLALSVLIGLYFGCCGRQDNANEYLLGSKQMRTIPIAISLVASNISGITILAVPTDIYRFGATYWLYVCMLYLVYVITYHVYLPVFNKLQLVSTYEYLMRRFDRRIRLLSSALFTISVLLYLPIVVYIPALALAQATHIDIHVMTPVLCSVCIFYTTIGGLKAVVWTDAIQFVVMLFAIFGVMYKGMETVGGVGEMWSRAKEGKRLDLDFDLDPTKRDTVLGTLIGTLFGCLSYMSISQCFVQKYLSLPTMAHAKKALILFMLGMFIIISAVVATGLIMYARYHDCDPFTAGKIQKHDEILPFYIMDVAKTVPGLAGLFLSGLFSAALSTLSASMNSLAGSFYEDFVSAYMNVDIDQKSVSRILKLLVVIIGVLSTAMVFMIEVLGDSILSLNYAFGGITNGPLLGLFTLGMLFPGSNTLGAYFGSLGSMAIMSFIVAGSRISQLKKVLYYPPKPVSILGCDNETMVRTSTSTLSAGDDVFFLFRITHYYYTFLGTILTLIIGVAVSQLTRKATDLPVDPDLISPVSQWVIKRFTRHEKLQHSNVEYCQVKKPLDQQASEET